MKILISPAKKMRSDPDTLAPRPPRPPFRDGAPPVRPARHDARRTPGPVRCSDTIAAQNLERLRDMDLRRRLTPALLSYVGLQYQYMAPGVLEQRQYDYLQAHLRILSGFYGVLRPFRRGDPLPAGDGGQAGNRRCAGPCTAFWGDKAWPGFWEPGDGPVVDLGLPGVQPGGGPPPAPRRSPGRLHLWPAPAGRPGGGAGCSL